MAKEAREQLNSSVRGLLESGAYSDFTIICGNDTYAVHKNIICPRSDYFANAVKFGKEAEEGRITLIDDDPRMVKLMLQYIYEADYSVVAASESKTVKDASGTEFKLPATDTTAATTLSSNNFEDAIVEILSPDEPKEEPAVFAPGDKWDFSGFATSTKKKKKGKKGISFGKRLLTHAQMYEIADKYNIKGLKELVKEKFALACRYAWDEDQFPIAVDHIFQSTPDDDHGLRDIIIATISENMSLLKKPEIEAQMMDLNGLAYGLLMVKATE